AIVACPRGERQRAGARRRAQTPRRGLSHADGGRRCQGKAWSATLSLAVAGPDRHGGGAAGD
ncbi:MAG: hypothetical protein OXH96_05160, partial [Spirochaetaceae bacterium]|nr:hypothetical protein [Spirochaetaceae bacterium]